MEPGEPQTNLCGFCFLAPAQPAIYPYDLQHRQLLLWILLLDQDSLRVNWSCCNATTPEPQGTGVFHVSLLTVLD
jgi:hypothetical protein